MNRLQEQDGMYSPDEFIEQQQATIEAFIQNYPFGMLLSVDDQQPLVSHLPFFYQAQPQGKGTLVSHMARDNPQWRTLESQSALTVVFQGPHAYVSPGWYHSPGVPTWNYTVVHVRGRARLIEGNEAMTALLQKVTAEFESAYETPWRFPFSEEKMHLFDVIVGFEIEIQSVQAKFKLSQNRPLQDQQAVIRHLARSAAPADQALSAFMQHYLFAQPEPS